MHLQLVAFVVSILTSYICLVQSQFDFSSPVIETSYGRIRGRVISIGDGKTVQAFTGIPYAAAPTRGNRFRDPQPVVRWSGELEANKKVSCPQTEVRFVPKNQAVIREDEDCLYLNVFRPNRVGVMQNYPVIFYLHPGEFKYGGKDFYKPDLLLKNDVILVVPNYRLGVFGFLGTDDYHCPGNFGIKDQIAALRWVASEIHRFQGDRNAITIYGHDAGAISAHMLMLTREARGLFNKTIISGGSAFTPWAFQEDPYWQAKLFGYKFGCSWRSRDIVRCLRDRGVTELINAARENFGFWFRPVVDKNITYGLLTDFPENLYQQKLVTPAALLGGLNSQEGSLDFYYRLRRELMDQPNKVIIEEILKPFAKRYTKVDIIASSVEYHYFQRFNKTRASYGGRQVGGLSRNREMVFSQILGDYLYNAPVDRALRLHSQISETYLYLFNHLGDKSFSRLHSTPTQATRDAYGVTHMDDLFYALATEYDARPMDGQSYQVASELVRQITTFAQPNQFLFQFPKYIEGNYRYTVIPSSQNYGQVSSSLLDIDDLNFWNTIINDIVTLTATPPPYFPYHEYEGFKAATWSLTSLFILLLLVLAVLVVIMYRKNREEKRSLKLLKARDKELAERELETL